MLSFKDFFELNLHWTLFYFIDIGWYIQRYVRDPCERARSLYPTPGRGSGRGSTSRPGWAVLDCWNNYVTQLRSRHHRTDTARTDHKKSLKVPEVTHFGYWHSQYHGSRPSWTLFTWLEIKSWSAHYVHLLLLYGSFERLFVEFVLL